MVLLLVGWLAVHAFLNPPPPPPFRCFSRDWRVVDYGVCELMDLLNEMPETTVTLTRQDTHLVISVPKRGPHTRTDNALGKGLLLVQLVISAAQLSNVWTCSSSSSS